MTLFAFGINHKTAPVELREKVAVADDVLPEALRSLKAELAADDLVLVSTCNRTEVYLQAEHIGDNAFGQWLGEFHGIDPTSLNGSCYQHRELQAVKHIMRVAAGLDSLVLGEPQIFGQVKQAFQQAKRLGHVSSDFERLFHNTFTVAKRVRSETEIGENAVSVAYAAVQLAKHIFSSLEKSQVLLIGAGDTIELVAKHLQDQGVQQIIVANRTLQRAHELAHSMGAQAVTLAQIPHLLPQADIVFSSTASQLPILGKGVVESALKKRKHQPMFLVDLAVPRDIEPEVAELADAYLYSVDDLQHIVEQNRQSRQSAADQAEVMIDEQVSQFFQWRQSLQTLDLVKDYRSAQEQQKQRLLERALNQLQEGKSAEQTLTELANKLTNALMHQPTKALTTAAQQQDAQTLDVLRKALGLNK